MWIIGFWRPANDSFSALRCSCTHSTLRCGARKTAIFGSPKANCPHALIPLVTHQFFNRFFYQRFLLKINIFQWLIQICHPGQAPESTAIRGAVAGISWGGGPSRSVRCFFLPEIPASQGSSPKPKRGLWTHLEAGITEIG